MADLLPNPTIYVQNLPEKLPKQELRKCMSAIFSQFGKILDVVCLKTLRLRGQAWVVFTDTAASTNALRTMQGFPFFDKPMRIQYAKTESDAVSKLKGTFKLDKKKRAEKNAAARDQMISKGKGGAGAPKAGAAAGGAARGPAGPAANLPPNRILFVQGLPEATTDQMLQMLFMQFPGFKEVRMVEARPGIAFVDFENDLQSGTAMAGLQGFKITPQNAMQISYAKQ
uniref:RRM domain-containing protein n=1 Tax=Dunaliella tertiolecta TaxID=3047 RepID=A0A7S3RA12_DUNTE|mmetsp:Transcript_22090/g.61154  ORF Transcript_22090/g.61154 Transcript_22090/m.61154 type:complete len:227 (-) Transcript_22090:615-1295(-)|eukprot:CAMPEP_0202354742 /NCGR_PEP_ID=MMETSP1126-20121109/9932_1 /ASSEMBLY_ACC=CAM_ASM_000457 /TAXON_ID=3047 /ORGANISM="Dunaliella tertiolecta, Strain CCMP1320" /LENGTH=226 /DNA_ID=CAMNT_0048947253 /DNA_START=49 /DNA_END=729 /DNA_ORIENTATION=+